MGALEWYLLGVATPLFIVLCVAVIGCIERHFDNRDRPSTFWSEWDD